MARPRNHARHVSVAVEDLIRAVTRLVETVGEAAKREAGSALATGKAVGRQVVKDGRSVISDLKRQRLRRALKAYWASVKGRARAKRVKKMGRPRKG